MRVQLWPVGGDLGLHRALEVGRERDVAAGRLDARHRIDQGQQGLQGLGIPRAHFEQHAGVAGDGMDLLDLGVGADRHQSRALAPALGVDVDKGQERLAHGHGLDQRRGLLDRAGLAQPLDPFVDGWRRKPDPLAQLGVAEGRVLGQNA